MALKSFVPSRAVLEAFSPVRRNASCNCKSATRSQQATILQPRRHVSTATVRQSEMEVEGSGRPRWSSTPPAMKAPYPTKVRSSDWQPYTSNSDPRKLDEMYIEFLGPNGPSMLSEETKWLAVTHKSFDHGRRGFNDRLAFLGKRILELQTSLGVLETAKKTRTIPDPHGREPFVHPSTSNVEVLLGNKKSWALHHTQISNIAEKYSIPSVVRWQPKDPTNLVGSGAHMVNAQAVFAIIGALALEQGGAVANRIAREKVIQRLGMRSNTQNIVEDGDSDTQKVT